jgi:hypothetical protein
LQLPTHLYHFTPQTATRLLQRAGWQVQCVLHQRTLNNLIGSAGLWLEDRGAPAAVHQRLLKFPDTAGVRSAVLLYPLAWALSQLGQTGRMTMWARRPAS